MLSPKKHVDKLYYVELDGTLTSEQIEEICSGVYIEEGIKSAPAQLEVLDNSSNSVKINLTIHEGRFHQVKRMFEAVGRTVTFLKRMEFGPLVLDPDLDYGEYRLLTPEEMKLLESYR
jgi:16S rRNA pseudouridine516 synthase